jgi:hypothetical protein
MSDSPDRAWMHVTVVNEAIVRRGGPEKLGLNGWLATVSGRWGAQIETQSMLTNSFLSVSLFTTEPSKL